MTLYPTLLSRRMLETLFDESTKYDERLVGPIAVYFFYQSVLGSYLMHPDSSTASKGMSLGSWLMYLCNTTFGILNVYIVLGEFAPEIVGPVGSGFGKVDTLAICIAVAVLWVYVDENGTPAILKRGIDRAKHWAYMVYDNR